MEAKVVISQEAAKVALQALGEVPVRVGFTAFQEILAALQAVAVPDSKTAD